MPTLARIPALRASRRFVDAAQIVLQRVLNALAGMNRAAEIKPDPELAEANKMHIIGLILELEEILTDNRYSACVREMIIDLFSKNLMHMDGGLPRGWSWRFVEDRGARAIIRLNTRRQHFVGLLKLLHVATQLPEQHEYEVTAETRQHLSLCLARLWDDMVFDTKRTIFREKVDSFFK